MDSIARKTLSRNETSETPFLYLSTKEHDQWPGIYTKHWNNSGFEFDLSGFKKKASDYLLTVSLTAIIVGRTSKELWQSGLRHHVDQVTVLSNIDERNAASCAKTFPPEKKISPKRNVSLSVQCSLCARATLQTFTNFQNMKSST